jgi:hypothetical protein
VLNVKAISEYLFYLIRDLMKILPIIYHRMSAEGKNSGGAWSLSASQKNKNQDYLED